MKQRKPEQRETSWGNELIPTSDADVTVAEEIYCQSSA